MSYKHLGYKFDPRYLDRGIHSGEHWQIYVSGEGELCLDVDKEATIVDQVEGLMKMLMIVNGFVEIEGMELIKDSPYIRFHTAIDIKDLREDVVEQR